MCAPRKRPPRRLATRRLNCRCLNSRLRCSSRSADPIRSPQHETPAPAGVFSFVRSYIGTVAERYVRFSVLVVLQPFPIELNRCCSRSQSEMAVFLVHELLLKSIHLRSDVNIRTASRARELATERSDHVFH